MMERVLGPLPQEMLKKVEWVISGHLFSLLYYFLRIRRQNADVYFLWFCVYSRHAEKYVRRGRLDWPEGATSRDSIKAVQKLARLPVCIHSYGDTLTVVYDLWFINFTLILSWKYMQNLIMQHVDHSGGELIHLVQGLLRYDPLLRLTAREALRHPFFTRDSLRR